jgi:hypothetical protein
MRVKLCARCPYTPRDLADQYDADAALYLCPACDLEHDRRRSQRRRTCPTTTTNTTGTSAQRAAPFVKAGSASFAIIAAAPPLCSRKCVEHFKCRREDDSRWLWRFRAA